MKYRAEIDGLRAIAVLAVVFYHAKIINLDGGYLGVDIFFVISGFLITSNILKDQRVNGFSLTRFYERRARRILPSLLLVLTVSSIYAWQYMLPDDLVDFSGSLLSTLAFGSNFWFYFENNYHAAESALKPLLHTWSLGVEEQFYLLFPLFLIAIVRITPARKLIIISAIGIASLIFAQITSFSSPEFDFYLLPTRLWELITGAVLALLSDRSKPEINSIKESFFALLGLGLIFFSVTFISNEYPHPSFITVIPILGSALVIRYGAQSLITQRLIGNRIMAWVGRLSYSIYLWHFPVFAFALMKSPDEQFQLIDKLESLTITLLLSTVGFYLVEKPLRNHLLVKRFKFITLVLVPTILLASWTIAVHYNNGFPNRLGEIESIFIGTNRSDSFLLDDSGRRCFYNPSTKSRCQFIVSENAPLIIGIGDSHANMISRPLQEYAKKNGFNFQNMILSHCPYINDAWRNTGFKAQCKHESMDLVRDYLKSLPPSIIVYTARFPIYIEPRQFDNGEGGIERSLYLPFYPTRNARKRGDTRAIFKILEG